MKNLRSIAQRLRYFPKFIQELKIQASKSHLINLKKTIVDGLLKANLVSPPLKPKTIETKKRQGKPRIKTPLIGWGLYVDNSMINGLKIINKGKKFFLTPVGNHYSGESQKLIWAVHEFGAIVKNAFGKNITVRIPPRLPLRRGKQRYLKSQMKEKVNKDIVNNIKEFIRDNKNKIIDISKKFGEK